MLPSNMPGARLPSVKFSHSEYLPSAHMRQGGSMRRGMQPNMGMTATLSPTSNPSTSAPTSAISPHTSCPNTKG